MERLTDPPALAAEAGAFQAAARAALEAAADPAEAAPMQAYMKSTMPFLGVSSPTRKPVVRALLAAQPLTERSLWEAVIRRLWDDAEFREERYVAVDLITIRPARGWQDPALLPLYEHLVVTGAWWDYVDAIAVHGVGAILRAHPAELAAELRAWAVADDMWVRRTAILAQNASKSATDTALLSDVIEANLAPAPYASEFFIRKAIGWALRDYSRTDPAWVRRFVDAHAILAPLSVREATKHLGET